MLCLSIHDRFVPGADISTDGVSLFLSSRGVTGAGYSTSDRFAADSLPRSRAIS